MPKLPTCIDHKMTRNGIWAMLVDDVLQVVRGQMVFPENAVRRAFKLIRDGTVLMPNSSIPMARER